MLTTSYYLYYNLKRGIKPNTDLQNTFFFTKLPTVKNQL